MRFSQVYLLTPFLIQVSLQDGDIKKEADAVVLEAKDKKTNTRILTTDPAINGAVVGLGVGVIGSLLVGALLDKGNNCNRFRRDAPSPSTRFLPGLLGKDKCPPRHNQPYPNHGYHKPNTGYQSYPNNGYQQYPNNGYQRPNSGYQTPNVGYQQPSNVGYNQPSNGYNLPNNGYNQPNNGYNQQNNGYNLPSNGYNLPNNGYNLPNNGYNRPNNGYNRPNNGYSTPNNNGYNSNGFKQGSAYTPAQSTPPYFQPSATPPHPNRPYTSSGSGIPLSQGYVSPQGRTAAAAAASSNSRAPKLFQGGVAGPASRKPAARTAAASSAVNFNN